MYSNEILESNSTITDLDISALEKKYGFTFPDALRSHYLVYNGGRPENCLFVDDDGDIRVFDRFISIKNADSSEMDETLDIVRDPDIMPDWLIPFGDDPGGDMFCMSIRVEDRGAIYYWSHEFDYGEDPEEQVTYLSESLVLFLNGLVVDEDDDE